MEMIIVFFLLLIVAAVVLLSRNKPTPENNEPAAESFAVLPEPEAAMEQELVCRVAEFMERDLFSLVIQPVVDFRNNTAYSGEVLSRLNHPERGMIFPEEFLPAIDAAGLYPQFDRYIFRKSCAWLSRSLAAGERIECISCNFSRKTLSEEKLADDLIQIAKQYGVPFRAVAVEITEREKETDARQMLDNLRRLRGAGIRIILDDFGNGVTSVEDLTRYPLDIVKIDRSLLLNTQTDEGIKEYRKLVAMATELRLEVVCEGIETEAENRLAQHVGCHYGQGFLFFRPMSAEQVHDMMEKSSLWKDEA